MSSAKSTRFSGGGVVAEFFRGLQKSTRFGGAGVVAEFFCGLRKPTRFSGGGSSRIFPWSPKASRRDSVGGSTRNFPLMGPFYIFRLSQRGARAPPESATGLSISTLYSRSALQICLTRLNVMGQFIVS